MPEQPKSIAFFDCSGPHSRGVHQLWFCDGEYIHLAAGAPDFTPTHPSDDQFYRIFDVRNLSKPVEIGRWWLPGTRVGDSTPPPERHPKPLLDRGNRAHNTNVYPDRPDRCYLGYIDAGMFIMDISDKSKPKPVSRWDNSPPNTGFTHTVLPLFDRNLMIVTDESTIDNAADWPKLIWILDARDERHLLPIATCPLPSPEGYANRGGRFGAHNIHENTPRPTAWHSDQIVIGTFFNGGLRAYDISNPYQPKEVGTFVAAGPADVAGQEHPDQRRVRGRARDRLHGRPLLRRPLHPGDGFLKSLQCKAFLAPLAGRGPSPPSENQNSAR